jgi:hypothetical protein
VSFDDEWPLTAWPTRGEVEEAIALTIAAAGLQPPAITHMVAEGPGEDDDEDFDDEDFDDEPDDTQAGLPAASPSEQLAANTVVTLVFRVPVASAVDTAMRLHPQPREDIERALDPPRDAREPPHYVLAIDLVAPCDEEAEPVPACVRIASSDHDNREAYGIVGVVAACLHERLEELSAFD